MVESYVKEKNIPRNKLLNQGYRSVGDWHSTVKVTEGEDERAGRWAGKEKTECGLHKDYFTMKMKAKNAGSSYSLLIPDVLYSLFSLISLTGGISCERATIHGTSL